MKVGEIKFIGDNTFIERRNCGIDVIHGSPRDADNTITIHNDRLDSLIEILNQIKAEEEY